ncbi:HNH endonuclease [Streptomyces sp. NPDC002547]
MAVPVAQQRKLTQRSGNICAFPGCGLLLTAQGTPEDPVVVLGEMAHIVAESPNGPRGDSPLTPEERNRYENLILLCNQHHQLIDSEGALAKYTVERLHAMKETHEQRIERRLGGRSNVPTELPLMVNDTVYSNVLPVT